MTTFSEAVRGMNMPARTANGMKALHTTGSAVVDLYYNIGASRGKDVIPAFVSAYLENKDLATRVALWARDARGGAGERKVFRDIFEYLCVNDPEQASRIAHKVPELGRWDDLLVAKGQVRVTAFELIALGLRNKATQGLTAKWMPRKGELAAELREFLGMSPKQYRKTLVNLTNVVETQMCANRWDEIDFNKVPSVASARYKKAFNRHSVKFGEYVKKLVSGDKTVKVNAGAVYPYDILKGIGSYGWTNNYGDTEMAHIQAQWDALPDYVGNARILALIDTSGSMTCPAGGYTSNSKTSCIDVAVSLGLYVASKNSGPFKDTFLTFSTVSKLQHVTGNIVEKALKTSRADWAGSTNLHSAFDAILDTATRYNVPQEEMPETILILSDMQFNQCIRYDDSAIEMIRRKYEKAGYVVPNVVFWNLNASYGNQPVKNNEYGVALVSGFSPSLIQGLGDLKEFTPENMMLKTIMKDRYDY